MTGRVQSTLGRRLDRTVRILCPLIHERVQKRDKLQSMTESELRRELVSCSLGSQVTYEMARRALENLDSQGLLADRWWRRPTEPRYESLLLQALDGSAKNITHRTKYRFAQLRSRQLASLRDEIAARPLKHRISDCTSAKELRKILAEDMPSIGPKQASMFLRNIGFTYELAILDSHVLRFISMQLRLGDQAIGLGTIASYEKAERMVINYAESVGYPVGFIDLAVWATMKAARELRL